MKKMSKRNYYRCFLSVTKGIFLKNPVLTMGFAVPFVVVATTSLQTAVGLSIGLLLTLVPVGLIMPLLMAKIPQDFQWVDYPLCALIAAFFVLPTRVIVGNISPALMDSVGVYFSLLCVSTLLFAARGKTRKEPDLAKVLLELVKIWIGAAMVLLLVGVVREIFGYGTLWGKALPWVKLRFSGVMVSAFGFILLGFVAALGKKIHRTILAAQIWTARNRGPIKEKLIELAHKMREDEEEIPEELPKETVEETSKENQGKEQE